MRRKRLGHGGLVGACSGLFIVGFLVACGPPATTGLAFQSTAVTGDACVVKSFSGAWYDYDGRKVLIVDVDPSARLSLLATAGYRPVDGRVEAGEVRFTFQGPDTSARLVLRHLPDGEMIVTPEGELLDHRTMFLTRYPWRQRLARGAEELGWKIETTYDEAFDWLIRVF